MKIILVSSRFKDLALLIEALLDLLAPLDRSIPKNISFLTPEMIDYLDAPGSYLIGVSDVLYNQIAMKKWQELERTTVVFDLDNELLMPKEEPLL